MTDNFDKILAGAMWLTMGALPATLMMDVEEWPGLIEFLPYWILGIVLVPVGVVVAWALGTVAVYLVSVWKNTLSNHG